VQPGISIEVEQLLHSGPKTHLLASVSSVSRSEAYLAPQTNIFLALLFPDSPCRLPVDLLAPFIGGGCPPLSRPQLPRLLGLDTSSSAG